MIRLTEVIRETKEEWEEKVQKLSTKFMQDTDTAKEMGMPLPIPPSIKLGDEDCDIHKRAMYLRPKDIKRVVKDPDGSTLVETYTEDVYEVTETPKVVANLINAYENPNTTKYITTPE